MVITIKRIIAEAPQIRNIVSQQNKEGFDWDYENSIKTPCRNCGKVILLFKRKEVNKKKK